MWTEASEVASETTQRTAWQMKAPDAKRYSLMGSAASERLLGCLAGILFSSVLALELLTGRFSSKEPEGFYLFAICFLDAIFFTYLLMTENKVCLLKEN